MSAGELKVLYTADDLLGMADGDRYELVRGELVEKEMSEESTAIVGWLVHLLAGFIVPRRLGLVMPEQTYRCFPSDPNRVRRPDISFLNAKKRPPGPLTFGHTPDAPDLAVEVVSAGDGAYDLEEKLADYRSAGIPLIWVVFPNRRTVHVYAGGSEIPEILHDSDLLTGGDILPGFSVKISELFPPTAQF
ncbi:MAG: Uma2 family endonuclease [Planctomycetota bacterium]|nr:Uma2 family endonuclease [Planctomycetota bacterium]